MDTEGNPYRRQRELLLALLEKEGAAALFATGSPRIRNHDTAYRFRPDSDFWYLSGFAEPDAVLVLVPGRAQRAVLFLQERNRDEEVWTGRRLGTEAAVEVLGVDAAHPIGELWTRLPELFKGFARIVYRTGADESRDRKLLELGATLRAKVRGGIVPPSEWIDPSRFVHEMRLFKTPREVELMRRAAQVSAEAHTSVMRAAGPGVNEAELDGLLEYTFRRRGCTGAAYTNIVAGGANACILHYVTNDQDLADGDLVLVDAGAEWSYYASDVTRTFPVNKSFGAEQRAVYDLVLRAQKAAIAHTVAGHTFASVHETALRVLVEGMLELGWIEGTVERVIEEGSYRRFFMHRTGHWLGLDVHDCGAYFVDGRSRVLEPGMVTTVEPGLYVAPDDETVERRWRGIGVRIEDDVLVTESGHDVLTSAIPKEVDDVEAACRGEALAAVGP